MWLNYNTEGLKRFGPFYSYVFVFVLFCYFFIFFFFSAFNVMYQEFVMKNMPDCLS